MAARRRAPVTLQTYVPDCDCLEPARRSTCKTTTSSKFGKDFWSCATRDSTKRCKFWRLAEDVERDMRAVFESRPLTQFFQPAAGAPPPAPPKESAAGEGEDDDEEEEEGSEVVQVQATQLQELNMDILQARYELQQAQHEAVQLMLQTLKSVIERCIKQHDKLLPTSPMQACASFFLAALSVRF